MKFVAKERKTIDAIRWEGSNVQEVVEWAHALGLTIESQIDADAHLAIMPGVDMEGDTSPVELWAMTLHGEVEIDRGSWAAYGGADVYPLDDGELHRLYEEFEQTNPMPRTSDVISVEVHAPSEFDRGFESGYRSGLREGGGRWRG